MNVFHLRMLLAAKIEALLAEGDAAIAEARSYLTGRGEVVDLSRWVTIKEYCVRFGIEKEETVLNWINRDIIPEDHIIIIEEYNNTKLIKAIPYPLNNF